jgi:radical SAM protein with 4Fe4S-binding SPASM domain
MRHNLEELPEVIELAAELGIGSVVTGTLVQGGRAAEGSLVSPPTRDQYLRLLDRYDAEPRFRKLYEKIGKVAALEWRAAVAPRTECCTFVENPYLTPTGRLYPCVLCHADAFAVAGVFEKSLSDAFAEGAPLWSSLLQISRSRADTLAECQDCPGKLNCAGGCMGRAWGSCGDLRAADDRCETRRTIYHRKQSLPT